MPGMRRISSQWTFFYKRVFPAIYFGSVLVFLAIGLFASFGGGRAPPLPFLLVPLIMLVVGYVIRKKLIFDLVDEVWDAGDALIVRNKGREERISFSDVMNVSYAYVINPPRVTLSLRGASGIAREITFCAPVRFIPFAKSAVIDDLIQRIDAARRR